MSRLLRLTAVTGLACVLTAWPGAALRALAITSSPNDPFFVAGNQWGLTGQPASIEAPAAWCVATGSGQLIADVDTGADFAHPDLNGKLVAGAQYLGGTAPYPGAPTAGPGDPAAVADGKGHGTFTAGIMAAVTNNGRGIAGAAPDARILVVKVLDAQGRGFDSDVANGIRWAADHGATTINVSIGPDVILGAGVATPQTSDIPDAVHYAAGHDVAVAIAAGNASLPLGAYLNLGNDALVVGALNPDATRASYSNSGTAVQIYAPGGTGTNAQDEQTQFAQNIVSTTLPGPGASEDAYAAGAGTSFATPHVTATLALLRSTGMSAADARSRALGSAVSRNGFPDVDAAHALGAAGTCGAPAAPPPPSAVPAPTAARSTALAGAPAPHPAPPSSPATSGTTTPSAAAPGAVAEVPQPSGGANAAGSSLTDGTPAPAAALPEARGGGGLRTVLVVALALVGALSGGAVSYRRSRRVR